MIGTECYETALEYVRRHAVTSQGCPAGQNELWGLVCGTDGVFYTAVVYFCRREQQLKVRGTRCSCRARRGCAHTAALLISATQADGDPPGLPALPGRRQAPARAGAIRAGAGWAGRSQAAGQGAGLGYGAAVAAAPGAGGRAA